MEERIQKTYVKENIDPNKQCVCWWHGDLKTLVRESPMACVTHQADRLTEDPRESMKDIHYRAEPAYLSRIATMVFFKCLLPFPE